MKKLILATTIALTLSLNVNAGIKTDLSVSAAKSTVTAVNSKSSKPKKIKTNTERCINNSGIAGIYMRFRQAGKPLSSFISEGMNETNRYIVLGAYKVPRKASDKYKKIAETEYANKVMLECLKHDK
jgi:siroheme synthase